jgi:hypothetical protein
MVKAVKIIEVQEWDDLVEKTYGRPYNFQQQDGCRERGIWELSVPDQYPEDYENNSISEEVNGDEMGVSFSAWLARDPEQKLVTDNEWEREHGLSLFWSRNFYPYVSMIANDLHAKGLLEAGEYVINIDW